MSTDEEVLATNLAFYAAFTDRDYDAMADVWASEADVACLHPGWPLLEGRDEVLDSWARILSNPSSPDVRCLNAKVRRVGEFAWVTCLEVLEDVQLAATNLFVREPAGWRMVHHQASPLPGRPPPVAEVDETWN
ncbi:MAG: nuclear transport factor 2 family protein [Myxococcota bacterium]